MSIKVPPVKRICIQCRKWLISIKPKDRCPSCNRKHRAMQRKMNEIANAPNPARGRACSSCHAGL